MPRVGNQKRSYHEASAEAAASTDDPKGDESAPAPVTEAAAPAAATATATEATTAATEEAAATSSKEAPTPAAAEGAADAGWGGSSKDNSSWGDDKQDSKDTSWGKSTSSGGNWWQSNDSKSSWSKGNDSWNNNSKNNNNWSKDGGNNNNDWSNNKSSWKKKKWTEEEQQWKDQGWTKGLSGWRQHRKDDDETPVRDDWDQKEVKRHRWIEEDETEQAKQLEEKRSLSVNIAVPQTPRTAANMQFAQMGQGKLPAPRTPGAVPATPRSGAVPGTPRSGAVPQTPFGGAAVPQTPAPGISNPQTPRPNFAAPMTPSGTSKIPLPATPRPGNAPPTPTPNVVASTGALDTPVMMMGGVKSVATVPATPAGIATPPAPGIEAAKKRMAESDKAEAEWRKSLQEQYEAKEARDKAEAEAKNREFLKKIGFEPQPRTPAAPGTARGGAVLPVAASQGSLDTGDAIPATPVGPPPGTPAMPGAVRNAATPSRIAGMGYLSTRGPDGLGTPGSTPGTPATPATLPGTPAFFGVQPFTPVPQAFQPNATGGTVIPRTPAGLPPTPGLGQIGLFRGAGAPPTVTGAVVPQTPGAGRNTPGMVPQTPGAPGTPGGFLGATPAGGNFGPKNFNVSAGLRTPGRISAPKTPNTAIFGPAPILYKAACWSDGSVMELRYAPRTVKDQRGAVDAPIATKAKAKIPSGWKLTGVVRAGEKDKDSLKRKVPDFNTWKREKRKEVRVTDATRAPTLKQAEPLGVTPNFRYGTPANVPENGLTPALNAKLGVTPNNLGASTSGGITPFMAAAGYPGGGGLTPGVGGVTPMLPKKAETGEATPFTQSKPVLKTSTPGNEGLPERTPFAFGQDTPMLPPKREGGQTAGEMTPGFPSGAPQAGGITPMAMISGGITPQVPAR